MLTDKSSPVKFDFQNKAVLLQKVQKDGRGEDCDLE